MAFADGQLIYLIAALIGLLAGSAGSLLVLCVVAVALGAQILVLGLFELVSLAEAGVAILAFNLGAVVTLSVAARRQVDRP